MLDSCGWAACGIREWVGANKRFGEEGEEIGLDAGLTLGLGIQHARGCPLELGHRAPGLSMDEATVAG